MTQTAHFNVGNPGACFFISTSMTIQTFDLMLFGMYIMTKIYRDRLNILFGVFIENIKSGHKENYEYYN